MQLILEQCSLVDFFILNTGNAIYSNLPATWCQWLHRISTNAVKQTWRFDVFLDRGLIALCVLLHLSFVNFSIFPAFAVCSVRVFLDTIQIYKYFQNGRLTIEKFSTNRIAVELRETNSNVKMNRSYWIQAEPICVSLHWKIEMNLLKILCVKYPQLARFSVCAYRRRKCMCTIARRYWTIERK